MRNKNFISRIVSVLMLVAIFTAQYASASSSYKKFQEIKKDADTEKSEHTTFNQINPESIIPNHHFHFDALNMVFPEIVYYFTLKSATIFPKYLFWTHNSYFEKLFGHLIVTNAP
jgi:hypothetical protein